MTHFQKCSIINGRLQFYHNCNKFSIHVKINIGSCSFWIKIGTYSLPTVQWQRILPWHYVYTGCCRMYISTGQHTHLKSHQLWPSFFPPMTLPLFKTVDPGQLLPKSNTPLSFSPKEQNVVLWNTVVGKGVSLWIVSKGLQNIILTFDLYKIVYSPLFKQSEPLWQ